MDHHIEQLSASLVREYLARKRLVKTLQQMDEEQSVYSSCIRNRLKLMKALHIGKLMKRNKKLNSSLDSMIEVIVNFLLGHVRSSKRGTKPPENNHLFEVVEDQPVSSSGLGDTVLMGSDRNNFCTDNITIDEECVVQLENEQESCRDAKEVCGVEEQYSEDREHYFSLGQRMTSSDETFQNTCQINENMVVDDYGKKESDGQIKCSLPVASVVKNVENSMISQQNPGESLVEDSEIYSESESSVSSVVDLLKDLPSGCRNDSGIKTNVIRSDDSILRMRDLSPISVADGSSHEEGEVIFAWIEESVDKEIEGDVCQTLGECEYEDSGEETEKWVRERPEKHKRFNQISSEQGKENEKEDLYDLKLSSQEELGSAAPSRAGVATLSRPGTQDSGHTSQHRLWLHEDSRNDDVGSLRQGAGGSGSSGGSSRRSPDLLRLNTHAPNFKTAHTFDDPLDTFRSGSELMNGPHSPLKSHSNGHIPNGLSHASVNGHARGNVSFQTPLSLHGRSVFDTDADVDIATVAAQRDQLRGARNIRGMMAPVMSKEEESHSRSANRRTTLTKQRSESILGDHEVSEPKEGVRFQSTEYRQSGDKNDTSGNTVGKRNGTEKSSQILSTLGSLGGISLRPPGDYLDTNRHHDIMAQSIRRQSLRGSKQSLLDGNYGSFESNTSSGLSMGAGSPEGEKHNNSEKSYSETKRKNLPKFIPNSHEDIQILNLQGFMDASAHLGDTTGRRKHKKKRIKRAIEIGHIDKTREPYKFNAKSRRKRNHRLSKSHLSDDDGEMMLKDIDDLDNKVAGLVLGPENVSKESTGRPITVEEASELRSILTGSPAQPLPTEWLTQNFKQNTNPNLSYGLIQKKGGPCGVLACIQAYIMKCLIFGTTVAPTTSPISPLRPSEREWMWALGVAITEILWKAGQEQKAVLAMPGSFAHFTEHGIGRYSQDGMTENLTLHEFVVQQELYEAVTRHLTAFTSESSSGCVVLLYSLIFTRGIENIHSDMDSGGGHLINAHGYSSQEIVNLLLTGRAFTNTFNGDQTLENNDGQALVLRGITHKAEIGLLSLFEHYDCYKVGTYLKTPQYPIWVVCCESHYSCLFSRDTSVTSDMPAVQKFDIYYYDGLAFQEDEIRLTIDLDGEESDLAIVPPLEHCIRTKWKNAAVNWNGTDPIL